MIDLKKDAQITDMTNGNYIFPKGIPGFESVREFRLEAFNEMFSLLTSVEDPSKSFITVSPFDFFAEYEFELSDDQVEELGISNPTQVVVRCIVTWHSDHKKSTANLLAPLIFNPDKMVGKQIVLQGTNYTTKHPIWTDSNLDDGEGGV